MKHQVNKLFRRFGYSISKAPIDLGGVIVPADFYKENRWLQKKGFKMILDIGANVGQFAVQARALFPEAKLHSFEPIPEVYSELERRFAGDRLFYPHKVGLGKEKAEVEFFQNDFSDSSSLLPMKDLHKENFPFTANERKIKIQLDSLDSCMQDQLEFPLMIKIDVQGVEELVIEGGKETISKAELVIIEVSFCELYENQVYFERIYSLMMDLGFFYRGSQQQLRSPKDGQILQADAIFERR